MITHSVGLFRASLAFALAVALVVLSSFVQREGPELESYGNLCGPAANENCDRPALKGGFPAPYLFDAPGVSVERQLSFGEDNLHPIAFALDIAIYWAAIMFAVWFTKRQSASARHRTNSGEA